MASKFISKSILIFVFSILLNGNVFGQTYNVVVILNDSSIVKGELLEITPDSVAVITEDTGKYLLLNGSEISTVYIKGLNKSIKYPITEVPDIFEKDKNENKVIPYTPGVVYTPDKSYIPVTRSTQFSIGAGFGGVSTIAEEAIEGFENTEFVGGTVFSGYFSTVFPGGFSLGLLIQSINLELKEVGESYGTLNLMPIMLLLQWYKIPYGSGFGAHGGIGMGTNIPSFEKGAFIASLERQTGAKINVNTESAFVFELSGGLDYFFSENISIMVEGRILLGNVGTWWSASAGGVTVPIEDIDNFFISNFQYSAGLRAWF